MRLHSKGTEDSPWVVSINSKSVWLVFCEQFVNTTAFHFLIFEISRKRPLENYLCLCLKNSFPDVIINALWGHCTNKRSVSNRKRNIVLMKKKELIQVMQYLINSGILILICVCTFIYGNPNWMSVRKKSKPSTDLQASIHSQSINTKLPRSLWGFKLSCVVSGTEALVPLAATA